jgi:hypothetical protein
MWSEECPINNGDMAEFLNHLKQSVNHRRKRWSYVTLKLFSNTYSYIIIWCKFYQVICITVLATELIIYIPAECENKVDIYCQTEKMCLVPCACFCMPHCHMSSHQHTHLCFYLCMLHYITLSMTVSCATNVPEGGENRFQHFMHHKWEIIFCECISSSRTHFLKIWGCHSRVAED